MMHLNRTGMMDELPATLKAKIDELYNPVAARIWEIEQAEEGASIRNFVCEYADVVPYYCNDVDLDVVLKGDDDPDV
eukprot:4379131-Karenia_brevis.AAC.1